MQGPKIPMMAFQLSRSHAAVILSCSPKENSCDFALKFCDGFLEADTPPEDALNPMIFMENFSSSECNQLLLDHFLPFLQKSVCAQRRFSIFHGFSKIQI